MRLAEFILENLESVEAAWETFARSIWPGPGADPLMLRDHVREILRAVARDMATQETMAQQADKSKGHGPHHHASVAVDRASDAHATERVHSGFDLMKVISEYRALRASILHLWQQSGHLPDPQDVVDVTRLNESIDQSLTEAARSYSVSVDRSRQMYMAILGHDLANPLAAVSMSAEMIVEPETSEHQRQILATLISTSAAAMSAMISDLLDFTQAGFHTGIPLTPAVMDFRTTCQEVINEMRAANPTRSLQFVADGQFEGFWDQGRLRQMVSNLLGNAIQGSPVGRMVSVTLSADAETVCLLVHNEGEPIPARLLPTIFEPFVRGSGEREQRPRSGRSAGLGLYIVREVVQSHKGTIEVTSTAEAGTTFKVQLPKRNG